MISFVQRILNYWTTWHSINVKLFRLHYFRLIARPGHQNPSYATAHKYLLSLYRDSLQACGNVRVSGDYLMTRTQLYWLASCTSWRNVQCGEWNATFRCATSRNVSYADFSYLMWLVIIIIIFIITGPNCGCRLRRVSQILVNALALELNIYSLAHHLCKMWIFYDPRKEIRDILWRNKRRWREKV